MTRSVVVVVVVFSLVTNPERYARESVWGVQNPTGSSKLYTIGRIAGDPRVSPRRSPPKIGPVARGRRRLPRLQRLSRSYHRRRPGENMRKVTKQTYRSMLVGVFASEYP